MAGSNVRITALARGQADCAGTALSIGFTRSLLTLYQSPVSKNRAIDL